MKDFPLECEGIYIHISLMRVGTTSLYIQSYYSYYKTGTKATMRILQNYRDKKINEREECNTANEWYGGSLERSG